MVYGLQGRNSRNDIRVYETINAFKINSKDAPVIRSTVQVKYRRMFLPTIHMVASYIDVVGTPSIFYRL